MRTGTSLGLVLLGVTFALPAGATVDRYSTRGRGTNGYTCNYEYAQCGFSQQCVYFYASEYVHHTKGDRPSESGWVSVGWITGTYQAPWLGAGCAGVEHSYSQKYGGGYGEGLSLAGAIRKMSISGDAPNTYECAYSYSRSSGGSGSCSDTPPSVSVDIVSTSDGDVNRTPYMSSYASPPYYRYSSRSIGTWAPATWTGTVLVNGVDVTPVLDDEDDWTEAANFTSNEGSLSIYRY